MPVLAAVLLLADKASDCTAVTQLKRACSVLIPAAREVLQAADRNAAVMPHPSFPAAHSQHVQRGCMNKDWCQATACTLQIAHELASLTILMHYCVQQRLPVLRIQAAW